MHPDALSIHDHLARVARLRAQHLEDPALAQGVAAVKAWQQARLARSHADLLASPRYGPATRFFLDDLYGPADFSRRDEQFARIVNALIRLFPAEVVHTVRALAELHALAEDLDDAMARTLGPATLDTPAYAQAWRSVGRGADRQQLIGLVRTVGSALDRHTRSLALRSSLRLMRAPARAAGLDALQNFLERGFDAFRAMRGADEFLTLIDERERALAMEVYAGRDEALLRSPFQRG